MKKFEEVEVKVNTQFGKFPVTFTIIDIVDAEHNIYLLYAQGRVCKGKILKSKEWIISDSVNLLDLVL